MANVAISEKDIGTAPLAKTPEQIRAEQLAMGNLGGTGNWMTQTTPVPSLPPQPEQTALNNPNAPPSLFTGVVPNAQLSTAPILTTLPTQEQTALSNPNAPPVQQQTSNLTLPPAPEQTALNNPNAPPVQQPAETQAIDNVDKVVKTATTPTGGTTATTGTQTATATTPETQITNVPTPTPTVTGVTPVASTSTADTSQSAKMLQNLADTYKAQTNPYMDKLNTMTFSYNPQDDPDYKLAASQMEQQVTDMMIGRGGLYSSVTSSALQSRLTELMGTYRKQAYDMFVQDRNFTMQMAQQEYDRQDKLFQKELQLYSAQTDRENTAWNQNMQMSEFEFNQKKEAFDQSYQLAQFAFAQKQSEFEQQLATAKFNADRQDQANALALQKQQLAISQANAAYNRQLAQAKQKQADAQNTLMFMQGEYSKIASEYDRMLTKWKNDGYADAEVSAFFGGNLQYIPYDSAITQNYIKQANTVLAQKQAQILNYAKATNDGELYLDTLQSFQKQATDPKVVQQQYDSAYMQEYNDAVALHLSGTTYSKLLSTMTANYNAYVNSMGTENYNKLISWLDKQAAGEK